MPIEITYTNLDWPLNKPFTVKGLGTLKNGQPVELTDEQVKAFALLVGRTVHQEFQNRGDFNVRTINSTTKGVSS